MFFKSVKKKVGLSYNIHSWKCARVVDRAVLEKRYNRKVIGGSNPPTSAA